MWVWTDEIVEKARALFMSGDSYSVVARKIGAPTRNTVQGKLKRLKVSRPAPSLPTSTVKPMVGPSPVARGFKTQPMPKLREVEPAGEPISISALTRTTCRWPVSGEGADTMFCGTHTERLYCVRCSKIAYRPSAKN